MSNFVSSAAKDGCEIDKLSIPYSALNETYFMSSFAVALHDRELVIDTLHVVVVKPLNDDCMVLAWISQFNGHGDW
jgi:hypothetical protein